MSAKTKGSKWGKKLSKFSTGWKSSEKRYKEMFGSKDVPPDTYIFQLRDFRIEGEDENPYIIREHIVLEGTYKGIPIQERMYFTNETGAAFLRRYLKMIQADIPEDIEDLETCIIAVKKDAPVVKGRLSFRNEQYAQIDVVSLIDDEGAEVTPDAGEETTQELDLDEMSHKELKAFVKDQDLDITGYRKMEEDDLRAAIAKEVGGDASDEKTSDGEGDIDFDELDEDEMRAFVTDQDIDPVDDLGFKTKKKYKAADEDDLRDTLVEFAKSQGGGSDNDDELLDLGKIFCASWDIDLDDDADLDDMREAIEASAKKEKIKGFAEKELDAEEKDTLTRLELETLIIKKKKSTKSKK